MVEDMPDTVAATLTAHHLYLTLNDILGGGTRPHNMCMPVPKTYRDRTALQQVALSGNPKFFFWSDTAPHLKERKECAHGACGVFSAPLAHSLIIEFFELHDALPLINGFVSEFARTFYNLPASTEAITFVKSPWKVPENLLGVVPFKAGETMQWHYESLIDKEHYRPRC